MKSGDDGLAAGGPWGEFDVSAAPNSTGRSQSVAS